MGLYRLLAGKHAEGKGEKRRIYTRGEVIETDTNLLKLNSLGSSKFEKVDEAEMDPVAAVKKAEDNLAAAKKRLAEEGPGLKMPTAQSSPAASSPVTTNPAVHHPVPATTGQQAPHPAQTGKPSSINPQQTFESMSVKELTQFAEAEEIDLKGAKTKDEILKVLKTIK